MGSLQDAFTKALPSLIGTGIAVAGGKLIDALSPPQSSEQLFQEYYRAVESSNLPRTTQEAEAIASGRATPPIPTQRVTTPTASPSPAYNSAGRSDMAVMADNITQAIESLKSAKAHTRCSLCRATLTELEKDVQEKTAFIQESTRLWTAMQDLKSQGALPKDAAWGELTDEQKQQVKTYAGK